MVGTVSATRVVLFSETNAAFGAPFLDRLLNCPEIDLLAIVTREPGHLCDYYLGDTVQVNLAEKAQQAGVMLLQPAKINAPSVIQQLRDMAPDYFIVANYQQILRSELLGVPTEETVNFHPSPLPRYAGLAPFYWMASNNETGGGVSAVTMTCGLDDGPIIAQQMLALNGQETPEEIRQSHFEASWRLFDMVLPTLVTRTYRAARQDLTQRTYYGSPPNHLEPAEMHEDPAMQEAG